MGSHRSTCRATALALCLTVTLAASADPAVAAKSKAAAAPKAAAQTPTTAATQGLAIGGAPQIAARSWQVHVSPQEAYAAVLHCLETDA